MSINAIWDAIKALAQSVQVSTIFPSTLLVMVNVYVILPRLMPGLDNNSSPALVIITVLILTVSYALYAFNHPLIRMLEGYKIKEKDLGKSLLKYERAREEKLLAQLEKTTNALSKAGNELEWCDICGKARSAEDELEFQRLQSELLGLQTELDYEFSSNRQIMPTSIGNTIAAFEDYSRTRYGMDSIAFWPRLVPVLRDTKYLDFVTQEKAVFDFLLNTCLIITILGIQFIYLNVYFNNLDWAFILVSILIVVIVIFWKGMEIAARHWGYTVRVAFDLYRGHLHRQLNLKSEAGETFKQEVDRWSRASVFLLTRVGNIEFKDFVSQSQITERLAKEKS